MTHEKQREPFYLLIKNSKYGHDYELYPPDQVDKVNISEKTKEWHDYLLHECDIEPNEDNYVEWYGGVDPWEIYAEEANDL